MVNFVTLSCPSCGGQLEISADIDRFACAYCGQEHIVKRGGGIVVLSPVVDALKHIKSGTDKTASELAIKRLRDEICQLENEAKTLRELSKDKSFICHYNDYLKRDMSQLKRAFHFVVYPAESVLSPSAGDWEDMIAFFSEDAKYYKTLQALRSLRTVHDKILEKQAQLGKHEQIVDQA